MKKIIHVIISLLYIVWGIGAPLTFVKSMLNLNFESIISIGTLLSVATLPLMVALTRFCEKMM